MNPDDATFRAHAAAELGPTPPTPADRLEWALRAATAEQPAPRARSWSPWPRVAAALAVTLLSTGLGAVVLVGAQRHGADGDTGGSPGVVDPDTAPTLPPQTRTAGPPTGAAPLPPARSAAMSTAVDSPGARAPKPVGVPPEAGLGASGGSATVPARPSPTHPRSPVPSATVSPSFSRPPDPSPSATTPAPPPTTPNPSPSQTTGPS